MFCKNGVLRNFAKFTGSTCAIVSFLIKFQIRACNFIKKEALAQVFSCELCKISKNTFSYRTPLVAASDKWLNVLNKLTLSDRLQKQPPEVLCKKRFLRNFAKFTGKHLCQSLFFNKVAGLFFTEHLRTTASTPPNFASNVRPI